MQEYIGEQNVQKIQTRLDEALGFYDNRYVMFANCIYFVICNKTWFTKSIFRYGLSQFGNIY